MTKRYDDIIHMPHHVSKTRKRMSLADRAAQFSPFAALTGHDAAIRETARLTDACVELAEDGKSILNEKLQLLAQIQSKQPEVTVTYFIQDERKSGGAYVTVTDRLRKVDAGNQALFLEEGRVVWFECIYDIQITDFRR